MPGRILAEMFQPAPCAVYGKSRNRISQKLVVLLFGVKNNHTVLDSRLPSAGMTP